MDQGRVLLLALRRAAQFLTSRRYALQFFDVTSLGVFLKTMTLWAFPLVVFLWIYRRSYNVNDFSTSDLWVNSGRKPRTFNSTNRDRQQGTTTDISQQVWRFPHFRTHAGSSLFSKRPRKCITRVGHKQHVNRLVYTWAIRSKTMSIVQECTFTPWLNIQ